MKQPPLDALKFQPLPELADALRASKERILQRWRGEVLRLLPGADELTRKQLDNSLPDVMTLPRKVWGECYRCPKFPGCNEIAMVRGV